MTKKDDECHMNRRAKEKRSYWNSFVNFLYTIVTFPARCFHVISSSRATLFQILKTGTKRTLLMGYSVTTPPPPPPPPFYETVLLEITKIFHKIVEGLEKANELVVPLAIAVDAIRIGKTAFGERKIGWETGKISAGIGGSWTGSYAGGFVGGLMGTELGTFVVFMFGVPSVASAVGSIAGGFIGSIGGSMAGTKGGTKIFEKLVHENAKDEKEEEKDKYKNS